MELAYHLLAGATAAVLASLLNSATAPLYIRLFATARSEWREPTLESQLGVLVVHVLAGAGLGLLFWLSWGLTAIVGVPWWQRGGAFALILWCVLCLPVLATQLLWLRVHWSTAVIVATQWLVTLTSVGLACAWSWAKAP